MLAFQHIHRNVVVLRHLISHLRQLLLHQPVGLLTLLCHALLFQPELVQIVLRLDDSLGVILVQRVARLQCLLILLGGFDGAAQFALAHVGVVTAEYAGRLLLRCDGSPLAFLLRHLFQLLAVLVEFGAAMLGTGHHRLPILLHLL